MTARRSLLEAALALALAGPAMAMAPPGNRVFRVGVMRPGVAPTAMTDPQYVALPRAMRDLGYVEGRNLQFELRHTGADLGQFPRLARELIDEQRVDALVAVSAPAIRAAKQATSTVPIVMFGNFDPVANGLVSNLARPGGNLTGVLIAPDGTLAGKRLELLRAIVPKATRFGLLAPHDWESFRLQAAESRRAAEVLGVELVMVEVRDGDYARAFAALVAERCTALLVGAHTLFVRDRRQIIELAARHKLPAMYEWREQVVDGGFMSYSTSLVGLYQRIASHLDRIFNGVAPGDIPIEQPTRFELVVNLKTARALDIAISPALRLQIDEVIE